MPPSPAALLLLLALVGGAATHPLKGEDPKSSEEKITSEEPLQPKDWDWSASTSGRLIPVSEATDDLPTPGYRMVDLRQRVPVEKVAIQRLDQVLMEPKNPTSANQQATQRDDSHTEPMLRDAEGLTSSLTVKSKNEENTENKEEDFKVEDNKSEEKLQKSKELQDNDPTAENADSLPSTKSNQDEYSQQSSTTENIQHTTHEQEERIPVDEGVIKKVILPEICSTSGIGCGDKRIKIEADSESPGKFFLDHTDRISPVEGTEYPGKFFIENAQRISPVDNSISNSDTSTENIKIETESIAEVNPSTLYDNLTEKLPLNNSDTIHLTDRPQSDGTQPPIQSDNEGSSSIHSEEKVLPIFDNSSLSSNEENIQSDSLPVQSEADIISMFNIYNGQVTDQSVTQNESKDIGRLSSDDLSYEHNQKSKEQKIENPLLSSDSLEVQHKSDDAMSTTQHHNQTSDEEGSSENQTESDDQKLETPIFQNEQNSSIGTYEKTSNSSTEIEAETLPVQRRSDYFDEKEINQESTTLNDGTEENMSTSEQDPLSLHKSEISEEEHKLMEESKLDEQYSASLRQNDDPLIENSSQEVGFWSRISNFFSNLF